MSARGFYSDLPMRGSRTKSRANFVGGGSPFDWGSIIDPLVDVGVGLIGKWLEPEPTYGGLPVPVDKPGLPMPGGGHGVPPADIPEMPGTIQVGSCASPHLPVAFIDGKAACPPGYHYSKTAKCCVKNRRMNPLNPRALSRATRRLSAFSRRIKTTEKALRKLAPPTRRRAPAKPAACGCSKCK